MYFVLSYQSKTMNKLNPIKLFFNHPRIIIYIFLNTLFAYLIYNYYKSGKEGDNPIGPDFVYYIIIPFTLPIISMIVTLIFKTRSIVSKEIKVKNFDKTIYFSALFFILLSLVFLITEYILTQGFKVNYNHTIQLYILTPIYLIFFILSKVRFIKIWYKMNKILYHKNLIFGRKNKNKNSDKN
jgi:hypothetical protein